jgi:hypothetical protein
MDSYRFVGHQSGLKKIRFVSWITNPDLKRFGSYRDHESSQFSKDSTCFHESNKSLKIEIHESGFANPNLKDSYRGLVSEKKNSQITRFVSFWKDSYTNRASLIKSKSCRVLCALCTLIGTQFYNFFFILFFNTSKLINSVGCFFLAFPLFLI